MSDACSPKVNYEMEMKTDSLSDAIPIVTPVECPEAVANTPTDSVTTEKEVEMETDIVPFDITAPSCQPNASEEPPVLVVTPIKQLPEPIPMPLPTGTPTVGGPIKRPRHKPEERRELLQLAVKEVQEKKISMRRAAQKYNLAKSSLCDYVRKNNIEVPNMRTKTMANQQQASNACTSFKSLMSNSMPNLLQASPKNIVHTSLTHGDIQRSLIANTAQNINCSFLEHLIIPQQANGANKLFANNASLPFLRTDQSGEDISLLQRQLQLTGPTPAKLNRMESPWNSAGLPTQVPMSTWSNGSNANSQSATPILIGMGRDQSRCSSPGRGVRFTGDEALNNVDSNRTDVGMFVEGADLTSSTSSGMNQYSNGTNSNRAMLGSHGRSNECVSDIGGRSTDSNDRISLANVDGNTTISSMLSQQLLVSSPCQTPRSVESLLPTSLNNINYSCSQPMTYTNGHLTLNSNRPTNLSTTETSPSSRPDVTSSEHNDMNNGQLNPGNNLLIGNLLQCIQNMQKNQLGLSTPNNKTMPNNTGSMVLPSPNDPIDQSQSSESGQQGRGQVKNDLLSSMKSLLSTEQQLQTSTDGPAMRKNNEALLYELLTRLRGNATVTQSSTESPLGGGGVGGSSRPHWLPDQLLPPAAGQASDQAGNRGSSENEIAASHGLSMLDFISRSPTPFHVIQTLKAILTARGFRELTDEDESWQLQPMSMVFHTSPRSCPTSLTLTAVGGAYSAGNGIAMIDNSQSNSALLRLVPGSERVDTHSGMVYLDAKYPGAHSIEHPQLPASSYFDRELGLAGQVIVCNSNRTLEQRLVNIKRPIAFISSSFQETECVEKGQFKVIIGKQKDERCSELNENATTLGRWSSGGARQFNSSSHLLTNLIAHELNVCESDIVTFDLYLTDLQDGQVWGNHNSLISSPHIASLFNLYTSLIGFIKSIPTLPNDTCIRVMTFHVEHFTSSTAFSPLTVFDLQRIQQAINFPSASSPSNSAAIDHQTNQTAFARTLQRSFRIKVSPAPRSNKAGIGLARIGRLPTSGVTGVALLKHIATSIGVSVDEVDDLSTFHKSDHSDLDSIPSVTCSFATASVANMSCRQICAIDNIVQASNLYAGFFNLFSKLTSNLY